MKTLNWLSAFLSAAIDGHLADHPQSFEIRHCPEGKYPQNPSHLLRDDRLKIHSDPLKTFYPLLSCLYIECVIPSGIK